MGDLKDFYLAGHSFGGFICGHYAIKYPQYIKKLLMLSPVGLPDKPADFRYFAPENATRSGPPRVFGHIVWKFNFTPFGTIRTAGRLIGPWLIRNNVDMGPMD